MFASLLHKIVVRNLISTPVIRNTFHQIISYSSILQIHENSVVEDSSLREKNIDDAPSITKLLKSYDFTDAQVAKFFTKFPPKYSFNSTELIKTKLDVFLNIGFSNTQLAKFISAYPCLLARSLEKRLKPNILLLKPFYETEEQLVRALSRTSSLLQINLETSFFPNIRTLTDHGVPHSNILKLANQYPRTVLVSRKKFIDKVHSIASVGFDPHSTLFCIGLHVITGISPLTWKKKVSLYKSLGWSEEDVVSAFLRQPTCMFASEKKIKRIMNFFVNIRQCKPSLVAENPVLINLSLEKRIVPRCLVINMLMKRQLVKKSSVSQYLMSNKNFLEKYMMPYQVLVPEILHAYNACLRSNHIDQSWRQSIKAIVRPQNTHQIRRRML